MQDVLKYVFLAGGLVGFLSAVRTWRLRRWQRRQFQKPRKPSGSA